ncbi:MAG: hypothetical protein GC153_13135, partial [Alphaproteobacteria bacterium]|nr:hypothetical protein [Alphaproteobacteria bacterium]
MKQSCTKTALTVSAGTTRGTCAASDLPGQIVRTADGSDGIVSVAAWVRPLSSDHVTRRYRPGYTLRELLDDIAPDRAGDWTFSAHVNGVLVLPHIYHLVRPNPGTHVQFMALAFGGGGGKSPLRVIASIAIIAAASWAAAALAPALSASLGVTSQLGLRIVGGALFSALNFVGQSILNALIPPVSQNISSLAPPSGGQSYFIEAARNIIPTRGTVIPRVLGKYVMYPYYGARPYTETQGDDQYLRMLFVWGYGPLDLSNFKIGDTALEDFDGVDIEHRYGYPDDAPLTLYTDSVLQTDLTVSLTEAGGWQVRTTPSNVDEISVDISFQSGLVTYSASGSRTDATVDFEIQYAPTGTEDWSVGAAGTILTARTVALSRPVASGFSSGIRYQSNIIVMDKATGNLSVVTGHTATSSAAAADGIVPTFAVALCRVIMAGNTTSIANADITDLRTDDLPLRAAAGDFLCIQSGPDMNVLVTGGTLYYDGISVTDARSTPFIKSERFPVETGTYDVRIRRTTPDATSSQVLDTAVWTALRGFRHSDPITFSKPVAK